VAQLPTFDSVQSSDCTLVFQCPLFHLHSGTQSVSKHTFINASIFTSAPCNRSTHTLFLILFIPSQLHTYAIVLTLQVRFMCHQPALCNRRISCKLVHFQNCKQTQYSSHIKSQLRTKTMPPKEHLISIHSMSRTMTHSCSLNNEHIP